MTETSSRPERYLLDHEIARGGMGIVYRAIDMVLNREIAVKTLQLPFEVDSSDARRFVMEAQITGRLQHPGIPAVHDLGTLPDGRPFLAMKLIRGQTLARLLARGERTRPELIGIFESICQAVAYAHSCRIIHRDLKPDNIMVGAFGEVQVMDWGLAKDLAATGRDPREPASNVRPSSDVARRMDLDCTAPADSTMPGELLGTVTYMPPEQARGQLEVIDCRSDVFSLGAVLCCLLTGKSPYHGFPFPTLRTLAELCDTTDAFQRLDNCGADPELIAVCKRCLAKNPADRPADGAELAAVVAAYRTGVEKRLRDAESEKAAAAVRLAEQKKKRRVQRALAAALAVILIGTGVAAWWMDRTAHADEARKARNSAEATVLLEQAETALRLGDASKAAVALGAAEGPIADAGPGTLGERLKRGQANLTLLRELDAIDRFRWTPVDNRYPSRTAVVDRWRAALVSAGLAPESGSVDEISRRISASPLRDRLVSTLDLWLVMAPAADVRDLLRIVDPDPSGYREAVRDAVAAGAGPRVAELAGDAAALNQTPGFAAALGQHRSVSVARRRIVLEAALRPRPGDLSLLMTMGSTYPYDQKAGADERVRWYQAATAAAPDNTSARISLGAALYNKGDFDGAVAAYRDAIRLDLTFAPAFCNLGIALKARGDLPGAIAAYHEAIRLDPQFASPHYNLGIALRAKGDLPGAIAEYREAVRLDPADAPARTNLGIALMADGDLPGAIAQLTEAVRLDPRSANAYYNLGNALFGHRDFKGAVASYREAVRLDPADALARTNLGIALKSLGDIPGAVTELTEAVRLAPADAVARINLGDALKAHDDLPAAVAEYREAIRLDPASANAHNNLGIALHAMGDLNGAVDCFAEAVRLRPSNSSFRNNLDVARKQKADRDAKIAPPPREVKR